MSSQGISSQDDSVPLLAHGPQKKGSAGPEGPSRILLIEDDIELASSVSQFLSENNFIVEVKTTLVQAKESLSRFSYDAVILDLMLPDGSGIEICQYVREHYDWTPIIMVTALSTLNDRILGFDAGTDDYLVKPYSLVELAARLKALCRRGLTLRPPMVYFGSLTLDPLSRSLRRNGVEIALTPRELQLLETLIQRAGFVVSRKSLINSIWHESTEVAPNIVDQYMRRLRKKICGVNSDIEIETLHGLGYRLKLITSKNVN